MLFSGTPFAEVWGKVRRGNILAEAPIQFIRFLEKTLGGRFIFDDAKVPYGRTDIVDLWELAMKLRDANVIKNVLPLYGLPDEPHFPHWSVECATHDSHVAGGMSLDSERDAFIPALAEAVERYIWMAKTDYFKSPQTATEAEMAARGNIVSPRQFVGFSEEQRAKNSRFTLEENSKYLWIKGHSYANNTPVWIPAQIISGYHGTHAIHSGKEPMILQPITTGLATGPTKEFALLNGALEILERDAFMITWMNQLTPPRLDLEDLAKKSAQISKLLELCRRYRLSVSAALLPTDAPTYAVCVIIEDDSGIGPNVSVGLRAHRSIENAVRGACFEALRIRQVVRRRNDTHALDPDKKGSDIVHVERAQYWSQAGSARRLDFLKSGPLASLESTWENDTVEEHWQRILNWCREEKYECASVDVGASDSNVSLWKIEMVTMPEMQPMHQTEAFVYQGGKRLRSVPEKFGYVPRSEPYIDEPHPFA